MVSSQNLSQLLRMLLASTMFLKCVDSAPSGLLGLTDTQRRNIFITGHIPRIRVERNSSGNDKPKTMVIKAMALPRPVTLPIYEDADELLLAERVASYGLHFDPDATAEAEGVENNVVDVNNSDVTAKGRLMRPMAPPSAQGPLIGPPPSRVEILLPQAQGRFPGDLETLLKLIESIEATASTESNEIKETDAGVTLVPMLASETESTKGNSALVDTTPATLMEPEMLGEEDSQASMTLMAENSPLPATAKPPSSVALNVNTEPSSTTPEATTTTTTAATTTTPSQPKPALTSSSTTEIPLMHEGNQPSSTSSITTLVFTQPSRTSPTIGTTPTTTAAPKPTTATPQQLGTMTTPFTTKLPSPATTTRPAPAVSPAAEMVSSTPSNTVLTTVMMKTTTTMMTPPPSSTMTSTTRTTLPTSLPPTTSKTSTTARSTPSSTSSSPLPSTTTTTTTVKTPTTTTTTKAPLTLATAMTTTTTSPPSPPPFVTTEKYSYGYSIADQDTGDFKSAKEIRNGDTVRGEYRVLEPDGITLRIVRYSVEPGSGFRAEVEFQKINFTTSSTPPPTTTTTRRTTPTETPSTTTPAPPIFVLLPLVEPINVADMVSIADLPFMVAEPDGVVVIDQPASGPQHQHQQQQPGQEEPILVPTTETEPPSFSSSRVNDGSAAASQLPKTQPNVDQATQQQDIPVKSDANSEVQPSATANTANGPALTAIDNPSSDPFVNIPAFDIPGASIPSAEDRRNARRNVIMDRMVSHRLRQVRTERATTPQQQHTISDVSKPALLDRRRVSMKRKPSSSTDISIANEPSPAINRIPAARTRRRRQ